MILEHTPLDENTRKFFRLRDVSDPDLEAIHQLTDESYENLWGGILPQGLTDATTVPQDHWSQDIQATGPSYPSFPVEDDGTAWITKENEWRTRLRRFFVRAFDFGPNDDVFVANYAGAYITNWATFVSNTDAFCPWHDVTIIIKQNSPHFGRLVEDYHRVSRGTRPAIAGFDSKSFCAEHGS